MRHYLNNFLEWFLWFPGQAILNRVWGDRLPYGLAVRWARFLMPSAGTRFRVLDQELGKSPCFKNIRHRDRKAIIARSMALDAADQLEILSYPRFGRHACGQRLALETIPEVKGLGHLDEALASGGVILVHLHFGAMQMVLPALAHRGYALAQVGDSRLAVLDNPAKKGSILLKAVLKKQKRFEESLPAPFFYTGRDALKTVKWLKAGKIVDLAMDGRVGQQWIETRFLDRPARFAGNPLRLARLTRSTVLPIFIIRRPDFRLKLVIEPPIATVNELDTLSPETMLKRFIDLADGYVRAYPCHFCRRMWVMHRQKPFLENPLFTD